MKNLSTAAVRMLRELVEEERYAMQTGHVAYHSEPAKVAALQALDELDELAEGLLDALGVVKAPVPA